MRIWVDADSCPKRVRKVLEKAANKRKTFTFFVANRPIPVKLTDYVFLVETENTAQSADNYILKNAKTGDLVVTRDIPLAKQLVDKNIATINDRGREFTANDINTHFSIRNFMYNLASAGLVPESTSSFNKKDLQNFAAKFDTVFNRLSKH